MGKSGSNLIGSYLKVEQWGKRTIIYKNGIEISNFITFKYNLIKINNTSENVLKEVNK